MNTRRNWYFIILLLFFSSIRVFGFSSNTLLGDTIPCLIELELDQLDNGDIMVSMIPDTTWTFPNNVVSTAQITVKVPTGQFSVAGVTNLIDGVIFFDIPIIQQPIEAPTFDYISFGLGSQGTANIPFQKGVKVNLFSIANASDCTSGLITLMNNENDPFALPNEQNANVGQQITAAGYNLADVPIGIRGSGISCGNTMSPDSTSDLGVQIVQQEITCFGEKDGLIIAKVNGGVAPYRYLWSTGDTLSTIEKLGAGTFELTVTDGNGDMITSTVILSASSPLSLSINTTDASGLMESDGTASTMVSGGNAPYQYNWSNGATDTLLTNLLPGDYTLSLTDATGCMIADTITINFKDCPEIDVMLDMTAPSCPGDSTGGLQVIPMSGMAPFTFLWETGDTTGNLTNIPTGNYMVTVTDANGCDMTVSALLADATPISIELTAMNGEDSNNGSITSMISGGLMPYMYAWSNGSNENSLSNLESGVYDLTITDANGCMAMASAVVNPSNCALGILDTFGTNLIMDTIDCSEQGQLCLPIPLDSMFNYSLFLDGTSYMDRITGCLFDTLYAYTYFTLPGRGDFGPYILDEWSINNVTFSGQFQSISALVDSMNNWDTNGQWTLDSDIVIIQGGLAANQYGEMTIRTPLTNSTTTLDLNTNLTPTGTLVTFESGNHELILADRRSACSDTFSFTQACVEIEKLDTTIIFDLRIGIMDTLSLTQVFGDSLMISDNECVDQMDENASFNFEMNSNEIILAAILEGTDDACYTIIDKNGKIITLTLRVNVLPEEEHPDCPSFIETDTFTIEVADCELFQICTPLFYDSLLNYAVTDNGTVFTGIVSACDNGNGTLLSFEHPRDHQLIFTNSENCKDTVTIAINAPACDADKVVIDTIEVNESDRTCIEFAGLSSPFQSVTDLCPEKNGEMAMLTIDGVTGCIDYTGIELGVDTACIEVCDVFGFCDTISFILIITSGDIMPGEFDAVPDSITTQINETIVFNPLGNDIFTALDTMYIVDTAINGMVTFNLDGTIEYVPNVNFCDDVIRDVFQYAICEGNLCDTTTVSVLVPCSFEAVDDSSRTTINEPVVFNALGNDVFLSLDDMYLVTTPDNGIATFNLDGTIRYAPVTDYCNDTIPDLFEYAICADNVCDTALVTIFIDCTSNRDFTIYNALSPNGDGINDVFQIDGIENYPNNNVQVYNRWGNMIYQMDGYKNEWNGLWGKRGELLPDGTYFYIFDTGEGKLHSGYLEIRR